MRYEFATFAIETATTAAVLAAIERYRNAYTGSAQWLAVWATDVGTLNRVQVVRAFASSDAMHDERARILESGDLFGATAQTLKLRFDTYAPFSFIPPLQPGELGKLYEVREYNIRPAGLPHVLSAWEAAVPERVKLSPLIFAGYALDGDTPRMIHICPYASLNDRSRIRGEAVAAGIWPPKGGPSWLTDMQSNIYMPAPYSPLR